MAFVEFKSPIFGVTAVGGKSATSETCERIVVVGGGGIGGVGSIAILACGMLCQLSRLPEWRRRLADELAESEQRVHVLHRQQKQGLGAAYRAGIARALDDVAGLRALLVE